MSFQLYCVTENKVSHWLGLGYCELLCTQDHEDQPGQARVSAQSVLRITITQLQLLRQQAWGHILTTSCCSHVQNVQEIQFNDFYQGFISFDDMIYFTFYFYDSFYEDESARNASLEVLNCLKSPKIHQQQPSLMCLIHGINLVIQYIYDRILPHAGLWRWLEISRVTGTIVTTHLAPPCSANTSSCR